VGLLVVKSQQISHKLPTYLPLNRSTERSRRSPSPRGELQRSELQCFMLWGFGIVFACIFVLIGFVLWDRQTELAPAIRKNQELEDRENKIETALKDMLKKNLG